jgi:hypothetical protein
MEREYQKRDILLDVSFCLVAGGGALCYTARTGCPHPIVQRESEDGAA